METYNLDSNFSFSATQIGDLEDNTTEYTCATIVVDESGSVFAYKKEIVDCVKEVVRSSRMNPRADSMMLRVATFSSTIAEFHGFKPLMECHEDGYSDMLSCGGATALNDAVYTGCESLTEYSRVLTESDFDVNGILIVITDGWENNSKMTPTSVKESLQRAMSTESMESLVTILVGVNIGQDAGLDQALQDFKQETGIREYIGIEQADAKSLAKLAQFISKSISLQSQALGTGGPSKPLTF